MTDRTRRDGPADLKADSEVRNEDGPQEIVDAAEQELATPEDTTNEG
jgi:hypothetical protein